MVSPRLWSYVFAEAYHGTSPFMILRLSDSLSALLRVRRSFRWRAYTLQNIKNGINMTEVHICHVGVTLAELEFEFYAVMSHRNYAKVLKLCVSNVIGVTVFQV